jgi:hypothetical protein
MNRHEHSVRRLLKAARSVRPETTATPPPPPMARLLAGWRAAAPAEDPASLAILYRRAVICAVLVMVACLGWSDLSNAREEPGVMVLTSLAREVQIVP